MTIEIRPARPDESGELTKLVLRSKAYWGYDTDFMALAASELSVSPDKIARTWVAEVNNVVVGVLTLTEPTERIEVDLLFICPEAIGTGVGRALWSSANRRRSPMAPRFSSWRPTRTPWVSTSGWARCAQASRRLPRRDGCCPSSRSGSAEWINPSRPVRGRCTSRTR